MTVDPTTLTHQLAAAGRVARHSHLAADTTDMVAAWATYTPAWTAATTDPTVGNGGIGGRYRQVGKTVQFLINVNVGSTTTPGTGTYSFSLPVAAQGGLTLVVAAHVVCAGVNYAGVAVGAGTTTVQVRAGSAVLGDSTPGVWAASDHVRISGTYEAA